MFARRSDTGSHLDNLQRDSWQLELIVTGFALAGMISGEPAFREYTEGISISDSGRSFTRPIINMVASIVVASYYIILFNFFVNVVVRCLWIAAIGLRSVNHKVRYEHVRLAPRFREFLRRRHGDFDDYVRALDNFSSLIFALTFLLIAIIASLFSVIIIFFLMIAIPASLSGSSEAVMVTAVISGLIYLFLAAVYMLDFLTLGYFKRFKRFARVYYPVYRFFGWVTLARLYRPFYHNLITNRRTRYVPLLLLLYLLVFLIFSSVRLTPIQYLQRSADAYDDELQLLYRHENYADQENYDPDEAILILPSEIIHERVLKVRIPVRPNWDRYVASNCPDLVEVHPTDLTFLALSGLVDDIRLEKPLVFDSAYIACLASPVRLMLDSTLLPSQQMLFNPSGTAPLTYAEFIAFVDLDTLPRGIHHLTFKRQTELRSDTLPDPAYELNYTVPFYYAPAERVGE